MIRGFAVLTLWSVLSPLLGLGILPSVVDGRVAFVFPFIAIPAYFHWVSSADQRPATTSQFTAWAEHAIPVCVAVLLLLEAVWCFVEISGLRGLAPLKSLLFASAGTAVAYLSASAIRLFFPKVNWTYRACYRLAPLLPPLASAAIWWTEVAIFRDWVFSGGSVVR